MSLVPGLLTEAQLEEQVVALVDDARSRFGIPHGCGAAEACEALRLRLVRGPLPRGTLGALGGDGRVVVSDAIDWAPRAEFTAFHEAVHHLLDEDGGLIEYLTEALHGDPVAFDRALERCCDVGAAEFLMPRARVRELVVARGFSAELVEHLAGPGRASVVAAAVQLAACASVDCYVAVCRHGVSPLWPHDLGLHVEQAGTRPGMGYPWMRGTAIPPDHLFHAVWQSKRPLAGPSFVPFRSGKRFPCGHAEARIVGSQLVGVLYLDHPPRKGQLSLDF